MGKDRKILIVDDDRRILKLIQFVVSRLGYQVKTAETGKEALDLLREWDPSLVLLDLKLPDQHGVEVLKKMRSQKRNISVIVITAYSDLKTAIEVMKEGAKDFIVKPFEVDDLENKVRNITELHELKQEVQHLKKELHRRYQFPNIVGKSGVMQDVYRIMDKVIDNNITVLIRGESGTGKEQVAKSIHYSSSRKDKPFVTVNCSAIPETLIESELFGYEKGSFTGALQTKAGKFEQAQEGTIFLDEIGDLAPHLQVNLLRVLQEKEIMRIGGQERIAVDVRIVAATHVNLEKAVEEKRFRQDLYYRLNVMPIVIPPLRDRRDDIHLLAWHFVEAYNGEFGKDIRKVDPAVVSLLERYAWPGNVRELENAIKRALLLADGDILTTEHVSFLIEMEQQHEVPTFTRLMPLDELERMAVKAALDQTKGNISQASQILKISRETMYRKMRKYGMIVPEEQDVG